MLAKAARKLLEGVEVRWRRLAAPLEGVAAPSLEELELRLVPSAMHMALVEAALGTTMHVFFLHPVGSMLLRGVCRYFGGGGGGSASGSCGAGGGGGSSLVPAGGSALSASAATAAGTSSTWYDGSAGTGGAAGANGQPGRIVLSW